MSALLSSTNSQSTTSKPKTTKGFFNCIAKNLFKCKSSKRYQAQNYEFISYGTSQSENSSRLDTSDMPRAVSTMIQDPSFNATSNQQFNFDKSSDISIYISDEQLHNQFLIPEEETITNETALDDTEVTRRTSFNSINFYSREEVTIVRKSTSPISNTKIRFESLSESCEYLHSTKISDQDLTRQQPSLESTNASDFSEHLTYIDTIIHNSKSVSATHACIQDYEATFVDDVSVSFADSVTVLKDDNEEYFYVQVESDGRRGFVPRNVVLGIDDFIAQLNQHRRLTSSMNTPVNV